MKKQLIQLHFANYFTKFFLVSLITNSAVSEAQKLSVTPSLFSQEERSHPITYFKKLTDGSLSLLELKPETKQADAPVVCYTITNPSAAQTICVDATGSNITVNTNMNLGGGIRFVRFTTDQMAGSTPTLAESNFIYSYTPGTFKDIAYVTPTGGSSPYTATYTFYSPDFPNTTNAPITYYVYAVFNQGVVNSTCGINPAVEIQITVKPKPTVNAIADQYVCAGSATSAVTLTGSGVSGTTYAWTNTTTSIGLAASGSTTIPSFTAVNATSNPVTATITATPTANSCTGDPLTSKIVVYPTGATMISGVAFNDYNENGIREAAEGVQAGIVAKVYNSAGTLMGTSTTDANGYWSVSGLTFGGANDKYRVEFSMPTALSTTGMQPSVKGTSNGTDVQFVSAASCNINFGVNYPGVYCQTNPVLATPCYTNGSRASNPNDAAVVLFNYNDRGQGLSHEMIATVSEVGAVWGETYNPKNKKLYVSAFIKRHVDLAPNGLGAIYEIDVTTPTTAGAGTPTLWLDINAATFVNTSNVAVNLGMPADPGIATRGLGLKTDPSRDNWAFDYVGKQGIGDIELSQDGQRLYVMDLTNRQVLCIDYTTKKLIWKLAVSTPTCAGGSTDIRPWALKEHNGVLYVGALCSGETNNNAGQLHFYVMQCNSLTAATSMSLTADLGSSVTKQDGTPWQYWAANATEAGIASTPNDGYMNGAQPIISNIDFDKDENMIIGFMDRFGHQVGFANYLPNTTNTNLVHGIAHGDITRATKSGNTYTVETAPWSFFYLTAAIPSPPYDHFGGGMFVSSLSGTNYVTANVIDPFDYVSAGTTWLKTSDGQRQGGTNATSRLEIVPNSTSTAYFGKANGLGDLSAFCNPAPIQIGNYVWYDLNKNGVQDPNEIPLSNIAVTLWKGGTQIASTTTDANGNYYFSDKNAAGVTWTGTGADTTLLANTAYEVRILMSQTGITSQNYQLTTANSTTNNGNDQNDSDASISSGYAVITLTTGAAGSTNHTYDFGFYPYICSLTLSANVSGCYDSNGNTSGGSSVATVQAIVDWTNNPSSETINVSCTGATTQSINLSTSTKPAILTFTVPANGSAVTVTATFSTTSTCTATQNITAPTGTCLLTPCQSGNTGGSVWRDFNNNGVQEANETTGVSGVTVKAFDCNGNLVATTTTDYLGQYTFGTLSPTPSTTNKYRIEFSNLPPQYQPTFNGTNGRTDIQFLSAASCTVNLGVNNPVDYCQANPLLAIPCFVNGTPLTVGPSGNESAYAPALVGVNYTASGATPTETALSKADSVGAIWGLAYQRESNKLFSAAYLKRHSGWGRLGSGGIYITDNPTSASPSTRAFVSLDALGFPTGGFSRYGLSNDKTQPSTDVAAFTQVGKVGLGDMAISDDGKYLYVTNLYDKKVYRLFINNPVTTPTAANVTSFTIPNPCGTSDNRPFALKYYQGKLYAGVICSGETAQDTTGLAAAVYQFNPDGSSPTKVLEFSLNYQRGTPWSTLPQGNKWYPWLNDVTKVFEDSGVRIYPQPMLTDIEFDDKGAMLLGFRDRFGDQEGLFNYTLADTLNVTGSEAVSGGDLLRADKGGATGWTLEKNGTSGSVTTLGANNGNGPGGGEFYFEDYFVGPYGNHYETVLGGLAVKMGSGNVVATNFDPEFPENTGAYNAGGVRFYSNSSGQRISYFTVYNSSNTIANGTFEKANGLGDVELLCNPEPIQVGNYVWQDTDKDGVQDPCEPPLSNVTVTLWKGGTQIASTTTDANGEYYFSDKNAAGVTWTGTGADTTLLTTTAYEVRIDTSNQTAFIKLALTTANSTANNGNDQNDNDAVTSGKYKVISFTTGAAGSVNHTYDFGFYPFCDTTLVVTNTTICNGSTVDLFTLASGVKGTLSYSTNGSTWTALTSPTNVSPSLTTTYYIKDTLVSGCFDIDTLVITVNPTPSTPSVSSPIMNICPLTTVDLTVISSALTPSVSGGTFEWHVSNSSSSALVTNQNTVGAGDYYLFERSPAGCYSIGKKVTVAIQVCCPSPACIPITITRTN